MTLPLHFKLSPLCHQQNGVLGGAGGRAQWRVMEAAGLGGGPVWGRRPRFSVPAGLWKFRSVAKLRVHVCEINSSLSWCHYDGWHFGVNISTAKCQLACPEGRPSEDCSLCLCEGHILYGEALSVTGVPVAGAWVALSSQPKVVLARTDARGHFRLTGVCSSSSTLIAISKEKFAPVTVASASNATGISWVRAVLKSAGESLKKINKMTFWGLRAQ